jgi:DNA-binding transcriptional ArsR family regulator
VKRLSLQSGDSVRVFAALGDPVRLSLVTRLCSKGPTTTVVLKQDMQLTRQAVTKHLRLLENAGVVRSQRVGRDRSWQIEKQRLAEVSRLLEKISQQWDLALERLRSIVEDDN